MIRRFLIPGALAAASPLHGQTFEEAVWANMALAIQLCEVQDRHGSARTWPLWPQHFRNAGFAERVENYAGDMKHWFTAPAGTVEVEIEYGGMPDQCYITTRYQGVTLTSQLLDALVPQIFPHYSRSVTTGPVNPATGQPAVCVRYTQPSAIPHVISVLSDTDGAGCVDDGTSRVASIPLV